MTDENLFQNEAVVPYLYTKKVTMRTTTRQQPSTMMTIRYCGNGSEGGKTSVIESRANRLVSSSSETITDKNIF